MSPLLDIQRRLAQVGRIRLGETRETTRNGKTVSYPAKLETFRLTSNDKARLEAAAKVYGGTVEPWPEQDGWQLVTKADSIEVGILPGQTLSQWWELWSGGGCQRRCDGVTDHLNDCPCQCPADHAERREQAMAKRPQACRPTTRLSVVLPRVPGLGTWRLDSHGYYAAVELAGAAELLTAATVQGEMLPARLRLDQRKSVKDGKTSRYVVPVLEIDATLGEVLGATSGRIAPAEPVGRLPRAQAEIGPASTDDPVSADAIPVGDDDAGDDLDLEV